MTNVKMLMTKVCILFLFLSNTAFAAAVNTFEILTIPNEKQFLLSADIASAGTIKITIVNEKGATVFSKTQKAKGSFEQKYDLKDFEKGNYFLKIEDEFKIINQPFCINETEVKVNSGLKIFTHKPYLKFNETAKSLAVNWMKSDTSDYEMKIEDKNANVLLNENIENNRLIHRSYDFSQLTEGTYYITIKDGEYTYFETIEVR
jgi:hypothetical protein